MVLTACGGHQATGGGSCAVNPATQFWDGLWASEQPPETPPSGIDPAPMGADCNLSPVEKKIIEFEKKIAQDPYYTTEQVQSINVRFGDNPGEDVEHAVEDYYTRAKTLGLTNFDASLVTAFAGFFRDPNLRWPSVYSDPSHTGLPASKGLTGVTPLNLNANSLPTDGTVPPDYQGLNVISTERSAWSVCHNAVEDKRNTTPTLGILRAYGKSADGDNVPVASPTYGNTTVESVTVTDYMPGIKEVEIILDYHPTRTLLNASLVRVDIYHLEGENASFDPSKIPVHKGEELHNQNVVLADLNRGLSDLTGGYEYVLDFSWEVPVAEARANGLHGFVSVADPKNMRLENWTYHQGDPMNTQALENDPALIRFDNPQLTGLPNRTALSPLCKGNGTWLQIP